MYRIARKNCVTDAERRKIKRVTASQLESWGIISQVQNKWIASNAYALLTGDPALPIRLKCGVFKGDSKAIFIDRRESQGSILELIETAHDYILAKINMGCHFKGVFRQDDYELPPDELRELVINAFIHRSYAEPDTPVFVAVYDTRLEIVSPGGLPRGLTVEKALSGCSKIRNKALAEALTYMKYVEGWGSGLLRVNQKLQEYELLPVQLSDDGISTRLNIYRHIKTDETINDAIKTDSSLQNEAINEAIKINSPIQNVTREAINEAIKSNPGINKPRLMQLIKHSKATIERAIAELVRMNKIEHRGSKRTGGYFAK